MLSALILKQEQPPEAEGLGLDDRWASWWVWPSVASARPPSALGAYVFGVVLFGIAGSRLALDL